MLPASQPTSRSSTSPAGTWLTSAKPWATVTLLPAATLYTSAKSAGTFPVVVAQAVVSLETSRRLTEAGLSPQQVADLQSIRPPKQVIVGRVDNDVGADATAPLGA